jgi:ATP synthase in type III secretion protein N
LTVQLALGQAAERNDGQARLATINPRPLIGRVARAVGITIEATLSDARIGEICQLRDPVAGTTVMAEVIGVSDGKALLAPLGDLAGLSTRTEVSGTGRSLRIAVGPHLLGRVLDGFGHPIDGAALEPPAGAPFYAIDGSAPPALSRNRVARPLPLGVRAIDGLLTCGEGQRLGIFGEPGAGKSSLLAQIVGGADVDVAVAAVIGERGREVREFVETHLKEQRRRSVLVVATADRPAVERVKAAQLATAIAEYFRDQGKRVLLVIDSITRFARAQRELGLAAGEPPTRRGFTPSVFMALPRLLERAGANDRGSITAFYTVLVEGDGTMDPIAEETRAILDGHIALSMRLAEADHFPAIDILQSRSRVMSAIVDADHQATASRVRALMARYAELELLLRVGEYRQGGDVLSDAAMAKHDAIKAFLQQRSADRESWPEMLTKLRELAQ